MTFLVPIGIYLSTINIERATLRVWLNTRIKNTKRRIAVLASRVSVPSPRTRN